MPYSEKARDSGDRVSISQTEPEGGGSDDEVNFTGEQANGSRINGRNFHWPPRFACRASAIKLDTNGLPRAISATIQSGGESDEGSIVFSGKVKTTGIFTPAP